MSFSARKNGAILGWMAGDAMGTTVEFKKSHEAKQIILAHSNFDSGLAGQGVFNLAPGQFTDDTEMGLAIMFGIGKMGHYNPEETARRYHLWYMSNPFDIGNTTINSVSRRSATEMYAVAKTLNQNSLSNGFLMRLPGMVALYASQQPEKLIQAVTQDAQLSHGHPEAVKIACLYAMVLYRAICGENANTILHYIQKQRHQSILLDQILTAVKHHSDHFFYNDREYKIQDVDGKEMGFVGYAFWLLLLSLAGHKSYRTVMLEIAGRGGDTDTNCCIVGAVMGALYPETIPSKWIDSLINCRCERHQSYPPSNPKNWMQFLE